MNYDTSRLPAPFDEFNCCKIQEGKFEFKISKIAILLADFSVNESDDIIQAKF